MQYNFKADDISTKPPYCNPNIQYMYYTFTIPGPNILAESYTLAAGKTKQNRIQKMICNKTQQQTL